MRKKILIAADQSLYSRKAMEYAAKIAQVIGDVDFALLHVQPMISQYLVEEAEKLPKAKKELNQMNEKNKKISYQLLEDCKAFLVSNGIDANCIEIKSRPRDRSIADDILKTAEDQSYDAIIVGRRGISGLQELFMGSVTTNLLAGSRVIPVWVVDGRFTSDKILVAVDGSSQSLRVVDHLAFIFDQNRKIRLNFLNVEPLLSDVCEIDTKTMQTTELEKAILNSNIKCISDFSAKARGILKKAGFEDHQISFDSLKKQLFTGKTIVDTAQKGDFGTVVIGKTGAGQSSGPGKVARYVIQKMSDNAVWVVP